MAPEHRGCILTYSCVYNCRLATSWQVRSKSVCMFELFPVSQQYVAECEIEGYTRMQGLVPTPSNKRPVLSQLILDQHLCMRQIERLQESILFVKFAERHCNVQ
jgi:hypothetical protein